MRLILFAFLLTMILAVPQANAQVCGDGGNPQILQAYLFHHTDIEIPVDSAGVWMNVSFNETCAIKEWIIHNQSSPENDTFIIQYSGLYSLDYTMSFSDSAPSPNNHILARLVKNGVEIEGSLLERDTTRQESDMIISHSGILVELIAGDEIKMQFTSDSTTISLSSHTTYGEHKDTAMITIKSHECSEEETVSRKVTEVSVAILIFLVGCVALYLANQRQAVMWSIMACVLFMSNILYSASIQFASTGSDGVFVGAGANIMLIGLNLIFTTYALILSVKLSFELYKENKR